MKKFSVKIIFLCISLVPYCSFALLSSTTCGTANHQTYATWDDAKAARVSVGSCSGGEGYIQKDYNPVTSNMSFWNCTGWD
ncbi:MAG: hypothetical protein KBB88_03850 [Candidatus Pacebacteria bacterium]|nr:hypothetical protein [Candidatus Paceibacterota bacterium]